MTSPVEFFPFHYSLMFNEGVSKGNGGSRFLTQKDLVINTFHNFP